MADIVLDKVNLWYGKTHALKDISFTLRENTICGLLGRNGAGKTSLMALLASYRPASSGSLTYGGQTIFNNPEVMPQIAFIRNRNEAGSGSKVKEYLHTWAKFRPDWDEAYAEKLICDFEIPENKAMNALSLGMQATVRGILGLASRCPVTLYDEAYFGMDAVVRKRFIGEILEDYMRYPRTILFSTHFIGEVENMLEEVLVLSDGNILLHEESDSLRSKGITLTGDVAAVDKMVAALDAKLLSERFLGNQKEVVLFGTPSEAQKMQIDGLGLKLSQPSLQDLFIHITEKEPVKKDAAEKSSAKKDSAKNKDSADTGYDEKNVAEKDAAKNILPFDKAS